MKNITRKNDVGLEDADPPDHLHVGGDDAPLHRHRLVAGGELVLDHDQRDGLTGRLLAVSR
jgi:hypothetical protein